MEPDEELEFGPWRLATAFLATLPLFLAYELGVRASSARNSAELLACLVLAPLGDGAVLARRLALGLAFAVAFVFVLAERGEARDGDDARPAIGLLARQVGEGLFAALLLGPLLVGALSVFDVPLERLWAAASFAPTPGAPPPLALVARIAGGAAWEELVFRLALYSLLFLATVRLIHFFGASTRDAAPAGDLVAILGSSVVFAAFHLEPLTRLFGAGGEPFERGVFLWRLLAGLSLAALFRWRGFAVAAWTHAFFNGALLLGAGPGVFSGS